MPRPLRVVIAGVPYHVTQRGNNRQDVFFTEDDREACLSILREQSRKYGLRIHAYCLMTNHVHLVVIPDNDASLGKTIGYAHLFYTQYINRFHGRTGHLWQGRFYSCPLDDKYYLEAMIYAERNPVRAKMIRQPWQYKWSSALSHVDNVDNLGILDMDSWKEMVGGMNWRVVLGKPEDKDAIFKIRRHLNRGRPLGSDSFLSKIESALGRRLRPLPVGRPKKKKAKK